MVKALLFFKITSSLYPFLPRPPIGPRTSPIGKRREKRKTLGRSGFTKPHSGKHPSSVCNVIDTSGENLSVPGKTEQLPAGTGWVSAVFWASPLCSITAGAQLLARKLIFLMGLDLETPVFYSCGHQLALANPLPSGARQFGFSHRNLQT